MERYDVVVCGGAFSGAATALLLRRKRPGARVLVVERAERFKRKVGEATVELSGLFLTRTLGLTRYLAEQHLPKQGLRYFFHADGPEGLTECSEIGTQQNVAVPSFLVERDRLDEHLLDLAAEEGADLLRPARVEGVERDGADLVVTVRDGGQSKQVVCRWLIDASGRARVFAKRLGWDEPNTEHVVAASWVRFTGVGDMDGPPYTDNRAWANAVVASRRLATNHFCGDGYWVWMIPLRSGETSVGVVYDSSQERFAPLREQEAFASFLRAVPGVRELLRDARPEPGDFQSYKQLAYGCTRYMERGIALVGDAAAFIDPWYSPGLDHCALSINSTVDLVTRDLASGVTDEAIDEHNRRFRQSYAWFSQGIFTGKYELMGEFDLVATAFLLDTWGYYLFTVIPAYRDASGAFAVPPLGHRGAWFGYAFMRFFKSRLRRIAKNRKRRGRVGRRNLGRRCISEYTLTWRVWRMFVKALAYWARAEAGNLLEAFLPAKPVPDATALIGAARPGTDTDRDFATHSHSNEGARHGDTKT